MGGARQRHRKRLLEKIMQAEWADIPSEEEHIDMSTGTFHPFPRLHLELRRQIFLAAFEPRDLTVFEQRSAIIPRLGSHDTPTDREVSRADPHSSACRKRASKESEKAFSHPWEARILNSVDQRTLAACEAVRASKLGRPHPLSCFKDIWSSNSVMRPPEVITFTVAEGIYPDLRAIPFWQTPYFRQKIIEQTSRHTALSDILHSQLTVSFERGTKRPTPHALFQVCRDSRDVAMEHYQLAFGGGHSSVKEAFNQAFKESGLGHKKIWVNFARDTIFVNSHVPNFAITGDYKRIRNIAVLAERRWWYPRSCLDFVDDPPECEWQKNLMVILKQLPDLKTLTVYHEHTRDCGAYCEGERLPGLVQATLLYMFAQPLKMGLAPLNIEWKLERNIDESEIWHWNHLPRSRPHRRHRSW